MRSSSRMQCCPFWRKVGVLVQRIRHLVVKSYEQVSEELQRAYPDIRGLSTRIMCRFCSSEGIHRTSRLSSDQLDRVCVRTVTIMNVPHHDS